MKKFEYNPTCYKPSLFEEMEKIIREFFDLPVWETITDETTWEDLGADSLDVVELIMEFEKEYGIYIPDERVEHCYTIGEAYDLIKEIIDRKNGLGL